MTLQGSGEEWNDLEATKTEQGRDGDGNNYPEGRATWWGMERNGMERDGMEWYGMEWNGMKWNGTERNGTE